MNRRIFGVDPGLTRCGIGVVEADARRRVRLLDVGVVRSAPGSPLAERLHTIGTAVAELLDEWAPHVVAVERVFAQHNTRTVMTVAQISGVVSYLAAERGIPVVTHTPSEVKAAVTGYGSAQKAQVQEMVRRILRLDDVPKPADAADALALAVCHAWRPAAHGDDGADVASETMTEAQKAWRAAERSARQGRTARRLGE